MLEKAENFIKSSEKVTDLHNQDWAKRNMTIKLFGVEKFWWVEKIPIENPVDLKLSPDFDYKLVMKILKERNFNIGFKSSCK